MKRIYVGGAYSASDVITVLDNMRNGMRLATEVFLAGYAPFCPFLDFHYTLMCREGERLSVEDYYDYSITWLEVCHAMILVPGWHDSTGTNKEIQRASTLSIPVFHELEELKAAIPP